jgi:hypothetical protein
MMMIKTAPSILTAVRESIKPEPPKLFGWNTIISSRPVREFSKFKRYSALLNTGLFTA